MADYYIVLVKHSKNQRGKFAWIAVREKLGVNFDKSSLGEETIRAIFQESFVPGTFILIISLTVRESFGKFRNSVSTYHCLISFSVTGGKDKNLISNILQIISKKFLRLSFYFM